MAVISNQTPGQSWRETAIERSEGITDAWEVTKTYAGRLAEWILFLCMIANIIEMLPGVALAAWLTNTIMGVQVVMLDVGGFSLASMGDQARENGDERAANKARATGYLLIAIMIITLLLVSVGILWPALRDFTGGAEKGLILVRVVMTVVYGHVLHSLRRRSGGALTPTQVANLETRLQEQVARMTEAFQTPPTLDYQEIARHLVPLLQDDLKSMIPTSSLTVDYQQVARAIVPLFESRVSAIRTTIVEEIRATLTPTCSGMDTIEASSGQVQASFQLDSGRANDEPVDVLTVQQEVSSVDSDVNIDQRIRALLIEEGTLSARAIAARVGCSPTTASKWKARIEAE